MARHPAIAGWPRNLGLTASSTENSVRLGGHRVALGEAYAYGVPQNLFWPLFQAKLARLVTLWHGTLGKGTWRPIIAKP